jgi:hypothetical protein
MTGTMLSWMQDSNADGIVLIASSGAARIRNRKGCRQHRWNPDCFLRSLGNAKRHRGRIGRSSARGALQVVDAISQGRSLWIATCNSIGCLPPE